MKWLRLFLGNQRGNMAVLFAGGLAVSAVAAAFAVDAASLYYERRNLQHGVDLAAIAAARNPANGLAIAHDVLQEAGILDAGVSLSEVSRSDGDMQLVVESGNYTADSAIEPDQRFRSGQQPANAVRVYFRHLGELYFARPWSSPPTIAVSAIATTTPQVAFSVGSRLASLSGGVANSVLNKLLGTNIALTAVDYNGIATAKVDAFAFLDALALGLGITVGTYDDILAAKADYGQIANALASLLNGPQRLAAQKIANAAGDGEVLLGLLFDLGELGQVAIGSGGQNLFADLSALELLSASAALGDGANQAALNLAAGVPGLLGIEVTLAVGEPPQGGQWFAIGPNQTVTRTAQIRLRIISELKLQLLLLPLATVRVPLYLDVAHSEAIVASAACPSGTDVSGSAVLHARPGVLRLVLGEVNASSFGDFNTTPSIGLATLVNLLGIKVTGVAHAEIAQSNPVALSFSSSDIAAGTVKTARTTTIVGSLVGSLLGDLELNAAGISLGVIGPLLEALLAPLAPVLDAIISTLLKTLGLSLGEADVRVYGVRCGTPVLVG
jgi:uncharacterized membrane protein